MPLKLKIERVLGVIVTEGYESKIFWDKTVEKFSHQKMKNIEIGDNALAFSVCVPLEVLKKRAFKNWYLTFVIVFENKTAKTFQDVVFRIRSKDALETQNVST